MSECLLWKTTLWFSFGGFYVCCCFTTGLHWKCHCFIWLYKPCSLSSTYYKIHKNMSGQTTLLICWQGGPWQFLQTSWSWSQPNCPKLMQHNMKCVRHEVMFRPSEIALSESRILQTSKFYCLWIGEGASVNGYSCYRIHNTKSGKHKTSLFCYRLVLLPFASKPWWARRYTAGCCILKISDIKDFTEEKHTRKTLSGANKA